MPINQGNKLFRINVDIPRDHPLLDEISHALRTFLPVDEERMLAFLFKSDVGSFDT